LAQSKPCQIENIYIYAHGYIDLAARCSVILQQISPLDSRAHSSRLLQKVATVVEKYHCLKPIIPSSKYKSFSIEVQLLICKDDRVEDTITLLNQEIVFQNVLEQF